MIACMLAVVPKETILAPIACLPAETGQALTAPVRKAAPVERTRLPVAPLLARLPVPARTFLARCSRPSLVASASPVAVAVACCAAGFLPVAWFLAVLPV